MRSRKHFARPTRPASEKPREVPRQHREAPPARAVPRLALAPNLFIAQTQPGFESVAWSEIAARLPGAREVGRRTMPERAGMTIFAAEPPTTGEPRRLLPAEAIAGLNALRTPEDLFAFVGYGCGIKPERAGLEQARSLVRNAPYVAEALQTRVMLTPGSRAGRRLSFRVVARSSGRHEFRRVDLQRAVERGVGERGDRSWRVGGEEAELEFWATLIGDELILGLRLTDARMRQREYKVAHRPGSLRPSVAAALAWLSGPQDDDIVLDPLCGAGTILIERAHLGRYKMLLGGDSDPEALAAARANVGPRYKPIELRLWDAAALPLEDRSVSKIVTNLPWGLKMGSPAQNRRLYPQFLSEFRRVLGPGSAMVLLTAETMLMRQLVERGALHPVRILRVSILGAAAAVYVCRG